VSAPAEKHAPEIPDASHVYPEIAELLPTPKDLEPGGKVKKIVDGDTIWLEDGQKIRFIGINTPETGEPMASNAKHFLAELLTGKTVQLLSDVERTDQYKRRLAYVFVDGRFVNAEIIRRGLAHAYKWEPNTKFSAQLLDLQKRARKDGIGIWSLDP